MFSSLSEAAWPSFRLCHNSEGCDQAAADVDDIYNSGFDKLDEVDKIPGIYCEASDLLMLPPIVVDSCILHDCSAKPRVTRFD